MTPGSEAAVLRFQKLITTWKVPKYGAYSGPYFPAFGLNTEVYCVNLHIQSEYGKIWTRKNSVFRHFSRSNRCSETFTEIRGKAPTMESFLSKDASCWTAYLLDKRLNDSCFPPIFYEFLEQLIYYRTQSKSE